MYTIRLDVACERDNGVVAHEIQHDTVRLQLAVTSDNIQTHISQLAMFFVRMMSVITPPC